jgi:response regulator RpfG family c-di-GMP phosphodiesterase
VKELQKKQLKIFVGFKGGLGKSHLAQNTYPVLAYNQANQEIKDELKFNIVEIDDTKTENIWTSKKINYNKFEVTDYKNAIVQIQRTYSNQNTLEVLDLGGGGEKVFQLLNHIQKMRLDDLFELDFMVITNRNASIFNSTKATLELIHNLFNCKCTLIHNKVVNDVNSEFQAFFGNQKHKIKSRYPEIQDLVKAEWIVHDDIHSLLDNSINETKQSTLDFYINSKYIVDNWIQYRMEALNSDDEAAIDEAMRIYDISYDFIAFFNKIKFEVER